MPVRLLGQYVRSHFFRPERTIVHNAYRAALHHACGICACNAVVSLGAEKVRERVRGACAGCCTDRILLHRTFVPDWLEL